MCYLKSFYTIDTRTLDYFTQTSNIKWHSSRVYDDAYISSNLYYKHAGHF